MRRVEAIVATLAKGEKIALTVVGGVLIDVSDGQDDPRAGDWVALSIHRGTSALLPAKINKFIVIDSVVAPALAATFALIARTMLTDQPRDQRPFFRILSTVLFLDRHHFALRMIASARTAATQALRSLR